MRRRTYHTLISLSQAILLGGLGLAVLWNVTGAIVPALPDLGWWGVTLALPGLLMWGTILALPGALAGMPPTPGTTFRLVYSGETGWDSSRAQEALRSLTLRAGGIELSWVREAQGMGCWLTAPADFEEVLSRLVADVFPGGQVEADDIPVPAQGVSILRLLPETTLPTPAELCAQPGVDGVFFHWQSFDTAIVSIWGEKAEAVAGQYAHPDDLLPGSGKALWRPRWSSGNPWPTLFTFPASTGNPGLGAVSNYQCLEPALRLQSPGLVVGRDSAGQAVGFPWPDLPQARIVWLVGAGADRLAADWICQAMHTGKPVCLFDGDGSVTGLLNRLAMRELARSEALLCDLERPAQSKLRLNPFYLPADQSRWLPLLEHWRYWLRGLGVTPGGLGQPAYRHTLAAVTLTARAAIERNLVFDPPGLNQALETPEFLPTIDAGAETIFSAEDWDWWRQHGRTARNADVHLRLAHLRNRLTTLLGLPEYQVLWRAPYLDTASALDAHTALFWRLPDRTGRDKPYITSLYPSLATALETRTEQTPALVFFYNLDPGLWAERLVKNPAVRLVLAAETTASLPKASSPQTLIVSRLNKADAECLCPRLPGLRQADLRRLPDNRLVVQQGEHLGTVDFEI